MRRMDRFAHLLPLLVFSLPAFGAPPEVKTVPALGADASAAHDVLADRPTTLKGTSSVAGAEIQATWEFGDGSEPLVFTVANGYDVSARHTYSGNAGTAYTAKLTVVDLRSGEASSSRYLVRIGERTLQVSAAIAIDEGLWYLHRTMNRTTGDWQGDCGRACNASGSVTASNVLAFEAAGFLATGDASNPYTETVERGLRALVRSTDAAVRTGDWVRALEAAETPERVVENGPADLMGRTFGEIVSRTLETQNLKAKASGARAAAASVALEGISSLIGRQDPAGYWTNGTDEAQASFETATALFAVASNFRAVASTISIVSSQVQVTSTGFLFSRVTQTFNGTMTVKNISGSAIAGPIVVVLTNLPVNVTLANAGGTFNGSPYIVVPSVTLLSPGQSASVALRFANPGNAIINFVPVTYSGTFPPDPVSVGCPASTGTNGTSYNSALLGNGGVLPYTFSIGPGALPGGLTLNPVTGAITGIPNSTGLFSFTANVSDGTGVGSGTASASCSINVTGSTVAITVQTVPAGLSIVVDGNTLTAPQVFNWTPGTNHTIATTTPQGSGGTRYVFNNWSDAGAISHSVTAPGSATTYTANFDTEYQLTTAAGTGGTVTPASGSFFPAGSVQNVSATANSGFVFANWTGPVADANSAATTVTMSAPVSVTANFTANTAITVQTVPAGLTIIVDGNTLTAPQVFNWTPGSNHTIATTSPQGSGGTRYVFNNWSDAGAISHSVTAPGSATTYTANFDTEYQLTTAAGTGGTVTPASGSFFPAGSVQNVSATANSGFVFANWTGPVASANSAATTVTMSAPVSVTANFTANAGITVQTSPAGLSIIVDGTTYTAPQTFSWTPGSNHTIATTTPQGSGGTRYVFNNWSDGLAIAHSVTAPGVATTYTANFDTQYQLTLAASPANGGTVTPASGSFFAAGSVQNVSATANSGFVFANWTGPVANANSAATTVTMSAPVSVTANFTASVGVTVQTVPAGLSIIVDGNTLTAPQVFNWTPGSNHTIATTSPQGSGGTRYLFNNWSDAGAISHSVTAPGVATTYTANFDTQYQLTTVAGSGGTVTPASGSFFAAGSVQNVSATPNSGFAFNGWTGPVASSTSAATTVTMSGPVTVTAAFATLLTIACPATTTAPIGTPYSDSLVASGGTATYTYSLQPGPLPPPLVLAPATGLITGTPTTKGTYNFVGKVVDSTSPIQQTATANCVIVVPNRAPTASGQSVSTNEDIAKVITLAGSDPDGDALTFTIVTPPAKGVLSAPGVVSCSGTPSNCTRNITYTPTSNLNGPDSFTFKVNDGTVDSGVNGTVTITINAVNDAPVATAKPYFGQANMRIVIPAGPGLLAGATDPGDPENGSPVFTVGTVSATSPAGGAVSVNTVDGSFTFDPPPGVTGNVTFTYTVCDNGLPTPAACSTPQTVTVNVAGPVIWFVNTAGGAGNGTLFSPFNTLPAATTAMGSNTNQRIFVYSGTQALGTAVTLPADGWLVGQGVTGASFDAVMGITPPVTAVARPSVNGTAPIIRGTVNMNGNNVNVRGLSIQPGAGVAGLAATLAGPFTGLVVSDIPNIGTSGAARAVDLRNVSGTMSITSVNASGADIGINLSDVNPSSGSFTVAGAAGTCTSATPTCTGGTISNVTDSSVKLANAKGVTLTRMRLNGSGNFGLNGSSVTNLSLETCLIDGTHGNAAGEGAVYVTNWLGSGTINASHITGGAANNIQVENNTGVLNRLTISNSTITNPSLGATANHGLRFATNVATNTGAGVVMNLTVSGSTFRNNRSNHLDTGATGLSTMDIVLNSNTFVTNGGYTTLAGAINITNDHQSDVTFDVNSNSFTGAQLSAVNFFTSNLTTNAASMIGKFRSNTIGTAGVTNSGSVAGNGFQVSATGAGAVTMNITGNAIRNWGGNFGMDIAAGDGSPTMNFTATGNTLNLNVPNVSNNLHGVHFNMGTTVAGAVTACVDVGGAGALVNTVTNAAPAGGSEIRVRQRNSSTVRLPGFSTGTAATYLFGRNTASNAGVVTTAGTFSGGGACTQAP